MIFSKLKYIAKMNWTSCKQCIKAYSSKYSYNSMDLEIYTFHLCSTSAIISAEHGHMIISFAFVKHRVLQFPDNLYLT